MKNGKMRFSESAVLFHHRMLFILFTIWLAFLA
jgi:hypothetical protein